MTHTLVGVGDTDWVHTEADLSAIAPPLTRILNRYPATAAAAVMGDEVMLITGVGGYAVRSYLERKATLAARAAAPAEPLAGTMPDGPLADGAASPAPDYAAGPTPAPEDPTGGELPDVADLGVPFVPVDLGEVS
ncbi:hypothetical protein GKE82_05875 [Conexibacter sp. W3-3-2]|nr:hypothetical protein [Conexibacter sp. W3-3-2]